jgi:hypothetical protein
VNGTSGVLQGVGRGTFADNDTWTLAGNCRPFTVQFDTVGTLVWTATNGDELHIDTEGQACYTFAQVLVFTCTTYTASGGTGRFVGATSDPVTACR